MIRRVRRLWGAPRWPGGRKAEDGETNPKSTSYLAKNLLSLSFAKSLINQILLTHSRGHNIPGTHGFDLIGLVRVYDNERYFWQAFCHDGRFFLASIARRAICF
jgi:hypothetical protein